MPAAAAMSSTVVRSKPCRPNRSNAACSSSARDVTRLRPARPAAGAAPRRAACTTVERTTTGACHGAHPAGEVRRPDSRPCGLALGAVMVRPECHNPTWGGAMAQQTTMEAAPALEQEQLAQVSLPAEQNGTADQALIAEELLVEEVSI